MKRKTINKDKILEEAGEFVDLYEKLVWASRKPAIDADTEVWQEYWNEKGRSISIEIRAKAVEELRKIVDKYPVEYDKLKKGEDGDYCHGFNSGALAAFRWILHSFDETLYEETANDWYPNLDT